MITNDLVKVIKECSDFLESNLPSGFSVSDIQYPNTGVKTPNGKKHIRTTWNNFGPISKDANNCYVVTEGIWSIDFMLPKGSGDAHGVQSAENLKALISADQFDDLWVEDAVVFPLPEEAEWYIVRLDITYQYEGFNNANYS